jgi:KDO2-lipid IV(A) lauroyltransferase
MRRLRFALEAGAFRILLAAARLIPRRVGLALGACAGRVGAVVDLRHRRIALDNLRLAFGPELPRRRARRLLSDTWAHFGRIVVDTLYFPRLGPAAIGTLVHHEGLDVLRAAYARGKGVVLFSGHFGHWELTALMQGFLDLPLALVTRPLDNDALERMLAQLRGRSGNRVIHKRNAVREALRELRAGRGVAIVIDQDARSDGVFVPFFGRPASTTPTAALLALRTGAAVVPTYSLPRPDGSYLIVYGPEVEVTATGDREADVWRVTARCTAVLEGWVRRWPALWLWMHRRWKTRPAGESPAAGAPG